VPSCFHAIRLTPIRSMRRRAQAAARAAERRFKDDQWCGETAGGDDDDVEEVRPPIQNRPAGKPGTRPAGKPVPHTNVCGTGLGSASAGFG
jgi:hypothetical protein